MNIWYHLAQNVSFCCCYLTIYYCFSSYFYSCKTLYPRVRENHTASFKDMTCGTCLQLTGSNEVEAGEKCTKGSLWLLHLPIYYLENQENATLEHVACTWGIKNIWKILVETLTGILNVVKYLRVSKLVRNFATVSQIINFSRRTLLYGVVSKVRRSLVK